MLQVNEYTNLIELKTVRQINELVVKSKINEEFDFGDLLYVGRNNGNILAVESFRLEDFLDGSIIPRFIHIILHPDIQRSKEAVTFLYSAEKGIIRKGYKKIFAYILPEKSDMLTLARKFGFKDDKFDGKGYYLSKKIGA